jgi:hypothetical protein
VGGFLQSPRTGAEYYHKGVAVLDYTTLSGAQGAAQVAWDGLWTGVNVQTFNKAFIAGAPICVMAVYNDNLHRNELWELTAEQGEDVGESTSQIPPAWVELRTLSCEKPFSQKKLLGLNLFLTDLRGNVEGQVYYRQDGDTCWAPWTQSSNSSLNFEVCAVTESTPNPGETNPAAEGMLRALPQRRYIRIGQPLRQCDTITTADAALFFETQLKIEWTGLMVIDKIELMALEQIQEMRGGCR